MKKTGYIYKKTFDEKWRPTEKLLTPFPITTDLYLKDLIPQIHPDFGIYVLETIDYNTVFTLKDEKGNIFDIEFFKELLPWE